MGVVKRTVFISLLTWSLENTNQQKNFQFYSNKSLWGNTPELGARVEMDNIDVVSRYS